MHRTLLASRMVRTRRARRACTDADTSSWLNTVSVGDQLREDVGGRTESDLAAGASCSSTPSGATATAATFGTSGGSSDVATVNDVGRLGRERGAGCAGRRHVGEHEQPRRRLWDSSPAHGRSQSTSANPLTSSDGGDRRALGDRHADRRRPLARHRHRLHPGQRQDAAPGAIEVDARHRLVHADAESPAAPRRAACASRRSR